MYALRFAHDWVSNLTRSVRIEIKQDPKAHLAHVIIFAAISLALLIPCPLSGSIKSILLGLCAVLGIMLLRGISCWTAIFSAVIFYTFVRFDFLKFPIIAGPVLVLLGTVATSSKTWEFVYKKITAQYLVCAIGAASIFMTNGTNVLDKGCQLLSLSASKLLPFESDLGAAGIGLGAIIALIVWNVCNTRKRLLGSLIVCLAITVAIPLAAIITNQLLLISFYRYNIWQEIIKFFTVSGKWDIVPLILITAPAFIFLIGYGLLLLNLSLEKQYVENNASRLGARRPLFFAAVLINVLSLSVPILFTSKLTGSCDGKKLGIFTTELMNFDTPNFERYGTAATGMFGLFKELAQHKFSEVVLLDPAYSRSLSEFDCLAIINPDKKLSVIADRIKKFVLGGGNLLMLVDHTDICGVQEASNKIIEPFGASIRFDSAFSSTHTWDNAIKAGGPLTLCFTGESNIPIQQGTGASIKLDSIFWSSILTSDVAFSDYGNRFNSNAMLGNYAFDPGELIGDISIGAISTGGMGRGKILLFGDTSSFQNIGFTYSTRFVSSIFDLLATNYSIIGFTVLPAIGLFLVSCLVAFGPNRNKKYFLAIVSCNILLYGSFLYLTNIWKETSIPRTNIDRALIVNNYSSSFTSQHWLSNSIDGLLINCYRNKLWPEVGALNTIADGFKVAVLIEPQEKITLADTQRALKFVKDGGVLLVSVSNLGSTNLKLLFDSIGCSVSGEVLGPVPLRPKADVAEFSKFRQEPQFTLAHSVIWSEGTDWSGEYAWLDRQVVASKKYGNGIIIVVADPKFLLDRSLEAEKQGWPGNILFFKRLLDLKKEPENAPSITMVGELRRKL